jgi:hypothetical protein
LVRVSSLKRNPIPVRFASPTCNNRIPHPSLSASLLSILHGSAAHPAHMTIQTKPPEKGMPKDPRDPMSNRKNKQGSVEENATKIKEPFRTEEPRTAASTHLCCVLVEQVNSTYQVPRGLAARYRASIYHHQEYAIPLKPVNLNRQGEKVQNTVSKREHTRVHPCNFHPVALLPSPDLLLLA